MAVARASEPLVDRLAGLDHDEPTAARRRYVRVVELERAVGGLDDQRENALGKRRPDRRQLDERPARDGQVEEPAVVAKPARVGGVAEAVGGQGCGEAPAGRGPHLLQADEVGLLTRERRNLIGEIRGSPGDVPADQLQCGGEFPAPADSRHRRLAAGLAAG